MTALLDKLKSNSTIKLASQLTSSEIFNEREFITTNFPILNIALSGSLDGGFTSGVTTLGGPSKNFKTGIALTMAKAYQDRYPDSIVLFYDSEFGAPQSYFHSFGIDTDRVLHTPIMNIEELKFDVIAQLTDLKRGDRVIIVIDSIGNLASKKEVDDAVDKKSVADMTRAKSLKSFFRMVTPYLPILDIPMVCISHSYETMEMFSKEVISGGRGMEYASDLQILLGRRQVKDSSGITGYQFVMNIAKSRYVREKSQLFLSVDFEKGINRYSGLLDLALEAGYVVKPSNGWYQRCNAETGEVLGDKKRLADLGREFWEPLLIEKSFQDWVYNRYSISANGLTDGAIEEDVKTMEGAE